MKLTWCHSGIFGDWKSHNLPVIKHLFLCFFGEFVRIFDNAISFGVSFYAWVYCSREDVYQ